MRFQYAGREYDSDAQLYYYRARWYDPAARRFISEDPIGLNGGINLYAYVGNNPINQKDSLGLAEDGKLKAFIEDLMNESGTWISGTVNAAVLTMAWATGIGKDTYNFNGDDAMTKLMRRDPQIQKAIQYYTEKNKNVSCRSDYTPLTNYPGKFGIPGLLKAGLNPARQFVGSYTIRIDPDGPNKIKINLWNTTSVESGTYGIGPEYERHSIGIFGLSGGNVEQNYSWSQAYP